MKTIISLGIAAAGALGMTPMFVGIHMPFVSDGYQVPAACVEWYDGCNMCVKNSDGGVSCSDRVCANPGSGFCREYADASSTVK